MHVARVWNLACGLLAAITVALLVAGVGLPEIARADGTACTSAASCGDARAASRKSKRVARKLYRLQNAERRRHGLRRLPSSRKLARAARRHARDMIRKHYFGHVSRSNRDVVDRVAATGYNRGGRFAAQENLYWWSPRRSAAQVLRAWMASAPHRANILGPDWDHFGLAVVMRSPFGRGGITVVGVFGRR
jgi:uncharacterized protein YkwD